MNRLCSALADMRRRLWRRRRLLVVLSVALTIYVSGKFLINSHDSSSSYDLKWTIRQIQYDDVRQWFNPSVPTVVLSPRRRVFNVSCSAVIAGDKNETKKAKSFVGSNLSNYTINERLIMLECDTLKRAGGYMNYSITTEELEFPIAFSILLYKEIDQTERLLRAIYRPHNVYCIHVDADAPKVIHAGADKLASCFNNVFIVSRKEYVVYAGFTRLQADLNCMHDLLSYKSWKYFINLPSQQFPLKTNLEIVRILKIYNGSNDIEGITGGRIVASRFSHRYTYKHVSAQNKQKIYKTNVKKDDPPYNITVVKGSAYGLFSRQFVEFVEENRTARELLDWFRDVYSPDEYYWATLHHNPHIGTPGAYKGKPDDKPWLAVYASWGGQDPCAGKFVRGVCVFGVGDLQELVNRKELFANKFYETFEPLALDCMEEWLYNKTAINGYFNTSYYEGLPFVNK